MALLYTLIRWGLGSIFIVAGSMKLLDPGPLAVLIEAYGIVPEFTLMPLAVSLAVLEVIAGTGLLFDVEGSLAAIAGLLVVFVAIISYGIWLGLDVDCGCFGPQDPEASAYHGLRASLFRDLAMLAAAVFLYAWRRYSGKKTIRIKELLSKLTSERSKNDVYAKHCSSADGCGPSGSRNDQSCLSQKQV